MQCADRFGVGTGPGGDAFVNELTRADITAAVVFQARPRDPEPRGTNGCDMLVVGILGDI